MRLNKNLKRILIVSLSNVGDAFLTVPVVHHVKEAYPAAEVTLLVGEGAKDVFWGDPRLEEVVTYDKRASLWEKWRFVRSLRKKKFELVIDLRNTLFPILLGVPFHTPILKQAPRNLIHKMDRHLWKLDCVGIPVRDWRDGMLWIEPKAEKRIQKRLEAFGLRPEEPFVLLSPGSKSDLKRWKASSFAALSDRLHSEKKLPVLFTGGENDRVFMDTIARFLNHPFHSLVGQTSIPELVVLIRTAKLLVTNDNATLHIASLLGTPTVAIFGPTDPRKYGPRADRHRVARKELFCSPCEKARCPYHHECMEELPSEEVYQACCELLDPL